jgi:hypothetical protein
VNPDDFPDYVAFAVVVAFAARERRGKEGSWETSEGSSSSQSDSSGFNNYKKVCWK